MSVGNSNDDETATYSVIHEGTVVELDVSLFQASKNSLRHIDVVGVGLMCAMVVRMRSNKRKLNEKN